MKLLSLTKIDDLNDNRPFKYTVLIYGKEWSLEAESLAKMKQNILMRDKHCDVIDIDEDLQLNFAQIK